MTPAVWNSLVPVRTNGSRPALFLIHGHQGNGIYYRDLAKRLGPDQPFYVFQSRGLTGREAHHTVEEMAHDYIQEMRSVQAHGPYFLAGYCFGGKIAREMALQLSAIGEEVALLAVMALYDENHLRTAAAPWYRLLTVTSGGKPFGETLWFHFGHLQRLRPKDKLTYMAARLSGAYSQCH